MENQALAICSSETPKPSDSSALVREWLLRFSVEHGKDVALLLPIWLEAFSDMEPAVLESLFRRALNTCKFFPKISEILGPLETVKQAAPPEEANEAWQTVLTIRRKHYNPDFPRDLTLAVQCLPERIQRAARAAGVFQEVSDLDDLHIWKKKAFLESYLRWEELENDQFLLPDGEIKDLLAGVAERKALPAPSQHWIEARAAGEKYRAEVTPDLSPEERLKVADELAAAARKVIDQSRGCIVAVPEERHEALRRQAELIKRKYPATEAKVS